MLLLNHVFLYLLCSCACAGEEVHARDGVTAWTPLHTAASATGLTVSQSKKLNECVKILLMYGADPNAGSRQGNTPLHTLANTAIRADCIPKQTGEMMRMLIAAGGDVRACDHDGVDTVNLIQRLSIWDRDGKFKDTVEAVMRAAEARQTT